MKKVSNLNSFTAAELSGQKTEQWPYQLDEVGVALVAVLFGEKKKCAVLRRR